MKVDVVSIFPAYLAALDLSLPGKAQQRGLLDLRVHDLRDWAHDRHRTVDGAPYGGGAGMVMRPEPWGEALDTLVDEGDATLIVPTPAGERFTQAVAAQLAQQPHLVIACGRYEGIDQRVADHYATRMPVRELSVGDYVLNGGEAAALVIVEAVIRLLPGVVGNAASLVEESHAVPGLLEHPVYTRPETWRGLEVPAVLRSGDHERVAAWRHAQALQRTAVRRPDLLHPSAAVTAGSLEGELRAATRGDAGELLTLQRACWWQEALVNRLWEIPALHESLDDVLADLDRWTTLVLRVGGRLVGAVRGRRDPEHPEVWDLGRLMVAPDLQGRGLGRWLLEQGEAAAPAGVTSYALFTGAGSERNLRLYRRAGYRLAGPPPEPGAVRLAKRRP